MEVRFEWSVVTRDVQAIDILQLCDRKAATVKGFNTIVRTIRTDNGVPTALEIREVTPEEEDAEISTHKYDDQRCFCELSAK